MMNSPKPIQQDLETPVGWWRCISSSGRGNFGRFKVGSLYPCVQNGPSNHPQGTTIPVLRRSYRIFPDREYLGPGEWTPFWDAQSQDFSCARNDLDFEFVRRFTYAEQEKLNDAGCSTYAFDSQRARKPFKLGFLNHYANRLLGK